MVHTYQPTDVVLAKVKGYPAWPALIVPIELIPEHVLRNRSKSHNSHGKNATAEAFGNGQDDQPQSDEEEDPEKYIIYSSILKFRKFDESNSLYCVKFFCDDSYIWVKNSDLKLLSTEECDEWLNSSKKKNKKLIPAYTMAQKGSKGIDVWEFIEYGSSGKPGEDEYIEEEDEEEILDSNSSLDYEDEEEGHSKKRPTPKRTSQRQSQKRKTEAQVNAKKNARNTRSRKPLEAEKPESYEEEEPVEPRSKKLRASAPAQSKAKGRSKGKSKAIVNTKPVIEMYHYEDDEDWSIVGLGPQDLSAQHNVSPLVNRLSQKKNFDRHSELKLDLLDRLLGINKLLIDLLIPQQKKKVDASRDDYEIILDELELALNVKGARDEFITVFQSNAELLTNLRFLFDIRRDELERWELWDQFQKVFISIYDSPTFLETR